MSLLDPIRRFKERQHQEKKIKKEAEERAHQAYLKELAADEYTKQLTNKKEGGLIGKAITSFTTELKKKKKAAKRKPVKNLFSEPEQEYQLY